MLHLYIATPESKIYDGLASRVILPTSSGVITVLPEHENLISTIDAGEIIIEKENGDRVNYTGYNGVINIVSKKEHNKISTKVGILLESSEDVSEIDLEEAEKALERAKEANKEKFDDMGIDTDSAMIRELNRVKLARRYK